MFCCCKDNEKIANIRVFLSFLSVGSMKEKRRVYQNYHDHASLLNLRFDIFSFLLGQSSG